ncbi:MAG TPA: DinB family protein, partial [Acidimicrobiia bacterium]|nr:DinB family protein [Acidimicrobiia bacterium]
MTAAEIRAENARLDEELLAEAEAFDPARLEEAAPGEWSAAQVMAHLGEFPRFFAGELRRWREDPAAVVGRTHEHPVRLAAVASPADALDDLVAAMRVALRELAAALDGLSDDDVDAKTENVKYGPEPLAAFFDRYVIGHKAGHLDQLRALATAAGSGP